MSAFFVYKYSLICICFIAQHGSFTCLIPIFINGKPSPYGDLSLSATLPPGSLAVNPNHIIVHPVPLGITSNKQFLIMLEGFLGYVIARFHKFDELNALFPELLN